MYFASMCRYIDVTRDDLYTDMKNYENEIKKMATLINNTKILKYVLPLSPHGTHTSQSCLSKFMFSF